MRKNQNYFYNYQFILYKMKGIVYSRYNRPKYMDNFDNVMEDLLDVKAMARKICDKIDNRDIINFLERIGMEYLMKLFNNARLYNMVVELVNVDYRLSFLKKELKKQPKKGKRNKNYLKEYEYLSKLYKKSVKYLRKTVGIKDRDISYKKRYSALTEALHLDDEDSFSFDFYSGFGDDYDPIYDDYSDDYSDDADTNELEDFVHMMETRSYEDEDFLSRPRRAKRKPKNKIRRNFSLSDMDEDDYDPYEYDFEDKQTVDEKINKMSEAMACLTENVQALLAKDEYDRVNGRQRAGVINVNDYKPQYSNKEERTSDMDMLCNLVGEMSKSINNMNAQQDSIVDAVNDLIDWRNDMNAIISDYASDEPVNEAPVRGGNGTSVIMNAVINDDIPELDSVDRYPDIHEELRNEAAQEEASRVSGMTREDIIKKINESEPSSQFEQSNSAENK